MNETAALLTFKAGVDPERVKAWIAALEAKGVLNTATVREFNPEHDCPTLYFP